jgi:hypothetical protein
MAVEGADAIEISRGIESHSGTEGRRGEGYKGVGGDDDY